jgi:hypothetical protein
MSGDALEAASDQDMDQDLNPAHAGFLLKGYDVFRLRSLEAIADGELHLLPFFQSLAPVHLDGSKMDEHVALTFARYETVSFRIVEPLHDPDNCI